MTCARSSARQFPRKFQDADNPLRHNNRVVGAFVCKVMKKPAPQRTIIAGREWATLAICVVLACVLGAAAFFSATTGGQTGALVLALIAGAAFVAIVGDPRRVLMAVAVIDIPLLFDIYIGHDEFIGVRGTTSGYNFSLTTIALAGLYALWVWDWLSKRNGADVREPAQPVPAIALLPLFVYLGVALLSAFNGIDFWLSTYELFVFGQLLLFYLYAVYRARSRSDVAFFATMIAAALLFEAVVMLGTLAVGSALTFGPLKFGVEFGETGIRIGGTLRNPNIAGSYLAISISVCIGMLLSNLSRPVKWLAGAAVLAALPALVFTQSRGGWVSMGIALVILVFVAYREKRISATPLVAGAIVAALVLVVFQDRIISRLITDDRGSASARGPLNQIALDMIADHPFLGVGINNFMNTLPDYQKPEFRDAWISTVHNRYLLLWSETGVFGLLAQLAFLAATLWLAYRVIRGRDALFASLSAGMFAGILGQLFHMAVDTYRWRSSVQLTMLMAGMIVVMYVLAPVAVTSTRRAAALKRYAIGESDDGMEARPA
jgi:O-antigen ligase